MEEISFATVEPSSVSMLVPWTLMTLLRTTTNMALKGRLTRMLSASPRARPGGSAARFGAGAAPLPHSREIAARLRPPGLSAEWLGRRRRRRATSSLKWMSIRRAFCDEGDTHNRRSPIRPLNPSRSCMSASHVLKCVCTAACSGHKHLPLPMWLEQLPCVRGDGVLERRRWRKCTCNVFCP